MRALNFIVFLAFGLGLFLSNSHASAPTTLQDALQGAYHNSLPLEAKEAQEKSAREVWDSSTRLHFADVSLTARAQTSFDDTKGIARDTSLFRAADTVKFNKKNQSNLASIGVQIRQPLYSAANFSNIEQHKHTADVATIDTLKQARDTLFTAVDAFLNLYAARALKDNSQHNVMFYEKQLAAANIKFEVGEDTIASVESTRAKLAEATAQLIEAEASVATYEAVYIQTVGVPAGKILEIPKVPLSLPATLDELIERVLIDGLEIKRVEGIAAIEEDKVGVEYAKLLPSADLVVSIDRSLTSAITDSFGHYDRSRKNQLTVAASLNVPLDFRGVAQAGVRASRHRAAAARLDALNERRTSVKSVIETWERFMKEKAIIQKFEAQVHSADIALQNIEEEYTVGTATYLNVIEAEQLALNAKNKLVSSRRDYIASAYRLLAFTGLLTPQTMDLEKKTGVHVEEELHSLWGTGIEENSAFTWQKDPVLTAYEHFDDRGEGQKDGGK